MGNANTDVGPDRIQQVTAMVGQAAWLIHKCIVNVLHRQGRSGRIAVNNANILTASDESNALPVDSLGRGDALR